MPWCEPCSRFFNPNSLNEDGTCPQCGALVAGPVETPRDGPASATGEGGEAEDKQKVPWHFWLVMAAVVVRAGWRLIRVHAARIGRMSLPCSGGTTAFPA